MKIIPNRKVWYFASASILIAGFLFWLLGGLKLGLDFTGGSKISVTGLDNPQTTREVLIKKGFQVHSVVLSDEAVFTIKTNPLDDTGHKKLLEALSEAKAQDKEIKEVQFGTIGSTMSRDIALKAYLSIALGLMVIIVYVAYSFRKTSGEFASYKYGICAALAMFHDALFVISLFAILGFFWGIEIDSLFVTALLTVISFSVHDTIVIFDRVRENLKKSNVSFEDVVEKSVLEMFGRSLNTSMVIILVITSLLLFGGEAIKFFMLALLVGMVVGTYSSIFIASPLLITWHNFDKKRRYKK